MEYKKISLGAGYCPSNQGLQEFSHFFSRLETVTYQAKKFW